RLHQRRQPLGVEGVARCAHVIKAPPPMNGVMRSLVVQLVCVADLTRTAAYKEIALVTDDLFPVQPALYAAGPQAGAERHVGDACFLPHLAGRGLFPCLS